MRWKKYIIETTVEREDEVCAVLGAHGIYSLEIQDGIVVPEAIEKEGGWFEELMPEVRTDEEARVIFYVEEDAAFDEELSALRTELPDESISEEISDEKDWRDTWKKYFHAFSIGNIHICPTWEEPDELKEGQILIRIDPGIAFGTGKHESTYGAIELMQRLLKAGDAVCDVGFGSGILSVVAKKLGAGSVAGTDIAQECIGAIEDNFAINDLGDPGDHFFIGDISSDKNMLAKLGEHSYDLVLANILADIIIGMKRSLARIIRPGGILICAGIIDFKEREVLSALENEGFKILEIVHIGEWTALSARMEGEIE